MLPFNVIMVVSWLHDEESACFFHIICKVSLKHFTCSLASTCKDLYVSLLRANVSF